MTVASTSGGVTGQERVPSARPGAVAPSSSDAEVRRAAAAFAQAEGGRSVLQLMTSFGPFLTGCVAMHIAAQVSWLVAVALAVPTGALLVRVFIVQHDCGHGSFFA